MLSLFFDKLAKWHERLIEPLSNVRDEEARQQASLMTSLMLWVSGMTLAMTFLMPIIRGDSPWPYPQFIGGLASTVFTFMLARLSRTGRFSLTGVLAIIYTSCILFAVVIATGNNDGLYLLYSLILLVVFSGLFLTVKATIAVIAVQSVAMLLLPLLIPGITYRPLMSGPFSSYLFMAIFILIVAGHRRRFDTEHRARLAASEERYKIVSELISDYAFSARVNPDGSYEAEWLTESFARFTGYAWNDMDKLNSSPILYHSDEEQMVLEDMARVTKGEIVENEYRILTKSGEMRWARVRRQPIWDPKHERVIRFYGVAQNITERKQAEAALAEERNILRTLIDNLPDQVFVKDRQSRFVIANIATAQHLGFSSPDMLVGQTDFDLNMATEAAQRHFENEQELMRSAQKPLTVEFTAQELNGDETWYLSTKSPLRGRSGEVVGLVGINRNVSEIKRAESQRYKLELERERLATVSRFTMAVSHDFRTSLTVIETNRYLAQRLLPQAEQDKIQPKLDKIHDSVIRLADQIQNLNTLSSLTHPRTELCNLNIVMSYLLDGYRKQAGEKNVEFFFQSDPTLPSTLAGEEEIRSALNHLFVNALHYTPPGGKIMLRTYQSDHHVLAEVRDTGPGIDTKDQERIFDLFYRVDAARGIEFGGVGLGLSIVKMVAEAHGGTVRVESQPGYGSTFTISLPLNTGS